MMKVILTFVLLLFSAIHLNAQQPHLKFDHLSVKEGLPETSVMFLKQDDLGYMWMGTQNGLLRYDGYKPKVYRFGNVIPYCTVTSMTEDNKKDLWFSTVRNGIFMYDRSNDFFKPYPYPANISSGCSFVLADNGGNLWGYADSRARICLVKFDITKKQFVLFDQTGPLCRSAMTGYPLWLGTEKGLYQFDVKSQAFRSLPGVTDSLKGIKLIYEPPSEPGVLWMDIVDRKSKKLYIERLNTRTKTRTDYVHPGAAGEASGDNSVNHIYEDSRKRLWFATQNGLLLFDGSSRKFTNYLPSATHKEIWQDQIYSIAEDNHGNLWLPCRNLKGLLYFNTTTHQFNRITADPNDPDALSDNYVDTLVIDREGILWAGHWANGVDKINPIKSAFKIYPASIRDGSEFHAGITNDAAGAVDGYVYFCNSQGIYKWKAGSRSSILVYRANKNDAYIDALSIGKDGTIYFGNGKGLQAFNPHSHQRKSYSSIPADTTTISSNKINVILPDRDGTIWIGTEDRGLCAYDPLTHKFKRFPYIVNNTLINSGDKLDDCTVNCLFEDKSGVIWTSTNNGGLCRFDRATQKFRSYLFDGRQRINSVSPIYEDSKGRLWIGTWGHGLQQFDREKGVYTSYLDENNGLLNNGVTGIAEDNNGFLWVTTLAGLSRVNPGNLSLKNYPLTDVLPGKNFLYKYNILKVNGLLALLLKTGIGLFDPKDLDANPHPPEVHIEKIAYSNPVSTVDNTITRSRYGMSSLQLSHLQNRVTFSYVALHYAVPAENKYAYRLTGYDQHWIQAGTQRTATYTNLSPGTYTFHVKAANSDGVWNNVGDSFTFTINPPWWQTWWAWLIWVALFVSAVYAFVAYRSRKLLNDKKILEHKVRIRTEEVMQQKEEIQSQRDNLEKAFGDLKTTQSQLIQSEKMASLGELTAGIAHEIQNPLNFVNNFSEVSTELAEELKEELRSGRSEEAIAIADDLEQNLGKINHHGKRASAIVRGMLEHSRASTGKKELTNINALADEYLRLSYHGLRAKDKSFNAETVTDFDVELHKINVIPQDIGRVLLNLFNNAFYAVNQKAKTAGADYKPEVSVTTSHENDKVTIVVKDNGVGIPDTIKEKIMQPFFTTKPTGEGTGLGLSLTYDLVVKGHGGSITVNSVEGEGSDFIVTLPVN